MEEKWQEIFGAAVIGGYTADNFGWCGSPAQYQPIALSIKAGTQGSNPASVAALLPGYVYKVEDRPLLMLHALITNMRYVIGYEGKIDISKTQEVTSNLDSAATIRPADPSEETPLTRIISRFSLAILLPSDYVVYQGQIPLSPGFQRDSIIEF